MDFLSKSRISLIGFCFLALGGCTEHGPDRAVWQATKDAAKSVGNVFVSDTPKPAAIDAPDPGETPYPNLAVVPRRPARPDAQTLQTEQAALVGQRQASQNFDAQLRALDPVLNPSSRPPEPPSIAAALAPTGAAPAVPAAVASAPISAPSVSVPSVSAAPPIAAPTVAAPTVAAPASQTAALPPFAPPVLAPATVPAPVPTIAATAPRPVAPPAAARATPNTAWLVGEVAFAEGSPLLTAEARRTLRTAVVAANEQGGAVRISPIVGNLVGPQDGALAPRRLAALAGELEALGLARDKIRIDTGSFRNARVAVEF